MKLIINELMGCANVFDEIPGRKYKRVCPLNKSLFHKMDHKILESWIEETVNLQTDKRARYICVIATTFTKLST